MDPIQSALSAFLNAIQATQATQGASDLPASSQTALSALLNQDVSLLFQGTGEEGLLFTLPSGQTVTAQGEFPYPEGTQVLARVAPGADPGTVRLRTLQTLPPAPPAILAPLLQGEAQALQARLTQAEPPPELEPLVTLFRLLGGALPQETAVPETPMGAETPAPAQGTQAQGAGQKAAPEAPSSPQAGNSAPAAAPAAQSDPATAPPAPGPATPAQAPPQSAPSPAQGAAPSPAPLPPEAAPAALPAMPGAPAQAVPGAANAAVPGPANAAVPGPSGSPVNPDSTAPANSAPPDASAPAAASPSAAPSAGQASSSPEPPGASPIPVPLPGAPTQPSGPAPQETAPPPELLKALAKGLAEALPGLPDPTARAAQGSESASRTPQSAPARSSVNADPAAQAPKAQPRAAAAPSTPSETAVRSGPAPAADPESWVSWVKAGVRALSDPAVSPREAPFHQAQGRDGTALYELPLPWAPQTPLQMWVESDKGGKGKGGKGAGTTRVLLGMSFSRLGETRLGIAKGPEGLQVRVWAQHPEALAAAQPGMEEELRALGTNVDLKILPLEPGPGGAIPSIRSLATGSTFQVLG